MDNSKVAPQNIMYDRRVVRGNTFAALVIPVSKKFEIIFSDMQPDPALIEKQKQEQMIRKQRAEQMRVCFQTVIVCYRNTKRTI